MVLDDVFSEDERHEKCLILFNDNYVIMPNEGDESKVAVLGYLRKWGIRDGFSVGRGMICSVPVDESGNIRDPLAEKLKNAPLREIILGLYLKKDGYVNPIYDSDTNYVINLWNR